MKKAMKIQIKHLPDDPKAMIDECPWYLKPPFGGIQFEVDPRLFDKNGTNYYKMVSSPHNITTLRQFHAHLSARTRMRLSGNQIDSLYIESKYAMPTGTNNRDFAFLLTTKEEPQ